MINRQRSTFPLSLAGVGESVEVVETGGVEAERRRLSEMGLTPGAVLRIVQADAAGAMILALRHDARLAVGRSTARKISVCLREEG